MQTELQFVPGGVKVVNALKICSLVSKGSLLLIQGKYPISRKSYS